MYIAYLIILHKDTETSHLGLLKVSDDGPWGRENWINNLSPFHIRLSFGNWLRPVVKGRRVGINRVFFVTFAVTMCYPIFGLGT
jgi:hypothetical protein